MNPIVMSKPVQSALLVVNGNLPREDMLRTLCENAQLIVCTDGAADQLRRVLSDIMPSVIVGDMDSLEECSCYHNDLFVRIDDQYSTDLEKALGYLVDKKAMSVRVVGFSGSRYDHTITNLQVLSSFHDKLDVLLIDDFGYGAFLSYRSTKSSLVINQEVGTTVSLIPLGRISGISTEGLEYPLVGETLGWGERSGQSNRMNESRAVVHLKSDARVEDPSGALLVYVLPVEFDCSVFAEDS